MNIRFLNISEIIEIHKEEIIAAGGSEGIRDIGLLESAVGAVQATFEDKYLMNIFEMAATYINSIIFNHPFIDGNKRTAAATALTFLYLNGYEINEKYDEELADKLLDLVNKKIDKEELTVYLKDNSSNIE
ncbi:MAG: type II toxin-antitoxin system death-on-curing family toxin [Calditrichaceae bacterium]